MAQGKRSAQQVRIIGGKWKGRKLRFAGGASLRPTQGRTRETLFNWLRPYIAGARCLDAFAGSGVLGFEALSLGAEHAIFVEQNPRTLRALQSCAAELQATAECTFVKGDALAYLRRATTGFDVVFVDPPFKQSELLPRTLLLLQERLLVKGFVYAEARSAEALQAAAAQAGLKILKQTRTGDAAAALLSPNTDIAARGADG